MGLGNNDLYLPKVPDKLTSSVCTHAFHEHSLTASPRRVQSSQRSCHGSHRARKPNHVSRTGPPDTHPSLQEKPTVSPTRKLGGSFIRPWRKGPGGLHCASKEATREGQSIAIPEGPHFGKGTASVRYLYTWAGQHSTLLKTNSEWSFLQRASSRAHSCKSPTSPAQRGQRPSLCDGHGGSREVAGTPAGNLYTRTTEKRPSEGSSFPIQGLTEHMGPHKCHMIYANQSP